MTQDAEARFLELAAMPGNETLRRECPNKSLQDNSGVGGQIIYGYHLLQCSCQGRGWLPLPEAERLGALVRINLSREPRSFMSIAVDDEGVYSVWIHVGKGKGPTPETALTEALLAARAQEAT